MTHNSATGNGRTDKGLADGVLDLFVYLPLGALLAARELAPELAEKGRRLVGDRLTTARFVGELAFKQMERAGSRLVEKGRVAPGTTTGGSGDDDTASPLAEVVPPLAEATPSLSADPPGLVPDRGNGAVAPAELAIPGYDTLSAFQVVQRLEGLSPAELDAIGAHEQAGRRRQTILNRIAQLRTAS